MPKAFDDCVKGGGKVRTKTINKSKYMHVCCKGGKCTGGHVKTKKGYKDGGLVCRGMGKATKGGNFKDNGRIKYK